jgi:Flp pilus assembly protein TadG
MRRPLWRVTLPNPSARILAGRLHHIATALEASVRPRITLRSAIARLYRDERGVSAVMVAISLTVLIGFAALGVETGLWYAIKRQNQSAADAAAISAAYEVLAGNTNVTTNLTPAATRAATQNGYTGAAPVVTYPYSDAIVSNAVAVTLRKTQGALLASLFLPNVTIETKAVARVFPAAPGCILTLGTTGMDVGIQGSSTLSAPDCSVMAASTDNCAINDHDQGGSITAKYLITAGQVSYGQNCTVFDPTSPPSNLQANLLTGVASQQFTDPYGAASGTTSFTNPCTGTGGYLSHAFLTCNIPTSGQTYCYSGTPSSGSLLVAGGVRFCNGLTIKNETVDLVPSGGIGSVAVLTTPNNYTSTPTVTFTGGGGSGAAATAVMSGNGKKVAGITLTSPGSGYTSAPTVTLSGGGGSPAATAAATVSNGVIWITDGDLALQSNGVLECTTCNTTTGKGVTIIFTTTAASGGTIGAPTMQSNPTIDNLNAPTSGTYAGLLMVQDTVAGATYTTTAQFQGNPGQSLNGLIYTPNSNLSFQGNPSVTNSCLLVVANTMTLSGNSSLATGGCPNTFPLPEVKNVALAS